MSERIAVTQTQQDYTGVMHGDLPWSMAQPRHFQMGPLGVGALSPTLYTMMVENNTLVALNTRTQSIPAATKSLSSKLILSLSH
jgi:hypothetical protein